MPGYRIEYASSGRAKCNGPKPCHGTAIGKGEIRFGTWVTMNERGSFKWRHWSCCTPSVLQNVMKELENQAEELDGFEELKPDDQQTVKNLLTNIPPPEEKKPKAKVSKKRKKQEDEDEPNELSDHFLNEDSLHNSSQNNQLNTEDSEKKIKKPIKKRKKKVEEEGLLDENEPVYKYKNSESEEKPQKKKSIKKKKELKET